MNRKDIRIVIITTDAYHGYQRIMRHQMFPNKKIATINDMRYHIGIILHFSHNMMIKRKILENLKEKKEKTE